jgi:group I intron endonuclease
MGDYNIYWIKRKHHSDIYSEGYVGISNNPKRRFLEHKNSKKSNSTVSNAVNKYEDIVLETLYENISLEDAKTKEMELRPCKGIGWNLAEGGGAPPNMKGIKRPDHAENIKGKNNPFYGKSHTEETKKKLSEMRVGEKNPFYGKTRPEHSKKMKALRGKDYPKFKGYFLTPFGKFESYKDACEKLDISNCTLYNYCVVLYEKEISRGSYAKSKFLNQNYDETIIGKTYNDLGFGFEYV